MCISSIKCQFLEFFGGREFHPAVTSGDVCNVRSKDIGAFELHEMSDPRASCTEGGFKILLSLEFKVRRLSSLTTDFL